MAKAATARRKPASRKKRTVRKSTVKRVSWVNRLLHTLPFTERQLQRSATWGLMALIAVVLYGVAQFFGLPEAAKQEFAEAAGRAGYEVKRVEVRGVDRVNELKVYEIVLAQKDRAMPLVDLDKVRTDLLAFGWIKDARVSRQLPDTLIVDIVERVPHAAWDDGRKLSLIDRQGVVLGEVSDAEAKGFPRITGRRANERAVDLTVLLDTAPALIPMVSNAEWIGNRRWNIQFKTGETLALPEGQDLAAAAWLNFARMDGINRLLGKGVTYFDLRDPDRAYLRIPREKTAQDDAADTTQTASLVEE